MTGETKQRKKNKREGFRKAAIVVVRMCLCWCWIIVVVYLRNFTCYVLRLRFVRRSRCSRDENDLQNGGLSWFKQLNAHKLIKNKVLFFQPHSTGGSKNEKTSETRSSHRFFPTLNCVIAQLNPRRKLEIGNPSNVSSCIRLVESENDVEWRLYFMLRLIQRFHCITLTAPVACTRQDIKRLLLSFSFFCFFFSFAFNWIWKETRANFSHHFFYWCRGQVFFFTSTTNSGEHVWKSVLAVYMGDLRQ